MDNAAMRSSTFFETLVKGLTSIGSVLGLRKTLIRARDGTRTYGRHKGQHREVSSYHNYCYNESHIAVARGHGEWQQAKRVAARRMPADFDPRSRR